MNMDPIRRPVPGKAKAFACQEGRRPRVPYTVFNMLFALVYIVVAATMLKDRTCVCANRCKNLKYVRWIYATLGIVTAGFAVAIQFPLRLSARVCRLTVPIFAGLGAIGFLVAVYFSSHSCSRDGCAVDQDPNACQQMHEAMLVAMLTSIALFGFNVSEHFDRRVNEIQDELASGAYGFSDVIKAAKDTPKLVQSTQELVTRTSKEKGRTLAKLTNSITGWINAKSGALAKKTTKRRRRNSR